MNEHPILSAIGGSLVSMLALLGGCLTTVTATGCRVVQDGSYEDEWTIGQPLVVKHKVTSHPVRPDGQSERIVEIPWWEKLVDAATFKWLQPKPPEPTPEPVVPPTPIPPDVPVD